MQQFKKKKKSVYQDFKSVLSFDKYKTHTPTWRFRCSLVCLHTLVKTCFEPYYCSLVYKTLVFFFLFTNKIILKVNSLF